LNINVGIIGTGLIGQTHLFSLKKIEEERLLSDSDVHIKIRGVADPDEEKLNKLKLKDANIIDYFTTNPDDIVKDKAIDVVYIATPTKFHKDYFIKLAEEGKNIFCEKPLAFSLEDIKELILAEKKHGISTQVGLVLRHCPVVWKMKQIIQENEEAFGKRLSFIFRDTQDWPIGTGLHQSEWRKDPSFAYGGSLFEHSIHDVDMLEYLFGDQAPLSKIFAKIRYVSPLTEGKLEDVATLNFEYEDGFVGNLISIWNKAKMDERRVEIFFENGYVNLEKYITPIFKKLEYLIGRKKKRLNLEGITEEYLRNKNYPKMALNTGPYLFESLSFLESIIKEKEPYPGLDIGYRTHEIIESAYQSSRENQIISFNS